MIWFCFPSIFPSGREVPSQKVNFPGRFSRSSVGFFFLVCSVTFFFFPKRNSWGTFLSILPPKNNDGHLVFSEKGLRRRKVASNKKAPYRWDPRFFHHRPGPRILVVFWNFGREMGTPYFQGNRGWFIIIPSLKSRNLGGGLVVSDIEAPCSFK